jgi:2-amino-4-hydroxy-6-hydroxymethyldihydropteridine diphosphokinase
MIYVSLGANVASRVGPPAETLRAAIDAMPSHGMKVLAVSSFYASTAWPNPLDPPFVNAMVKIETRKGPLELLSALLSIERQFGRVRKSRWEPRCLDLDLIDYGGLILDTDELSLPHPRLHERGFVLRPLKDLCPAWRHPDTGEGVAHLLEIAGEEGVRPLGVDREKG